MAEAIVAVEAYHDELKEWKLIKNMIGEEDEMKQKAEAIKAEWLASGWPEKDIRISKTKFREFNKKYRED